MDEPILTVVRLCRFCGKTFEARRSDAQFCGAHCRQCAFRWRRQLPHSADKAAYWLSAVGEYLNYPDSYPHARKLLRKLNRQIDALLQPNSPKTEE